MMGWGWYLCDEAGNEAVSLEIDFADGVNQTIPCLINRARDDVVQAYPANPNASTAGFIFLSKLYSASNIANASLLVSLWNGEVERHPLPGFPDKFSPDSIAPQTVFSRTKTAWREAKAGRFAYLLERLHATLQQFVSRATNRTASAQLPTGTVDLLFDHNLGGGANKYREEKIAQLRQFGKTVAVITFDLPRLLYRLEIHSERSKQHEAFENPRTLRERLSQMRFATIHVNNFVSYPDPIDMLQLVKHLQQQSQSQLTIYLHDFLPACPSFTLINADGRYCGIPDANTCAVCLKNNKTIFPSFVTLKEITPWRVEWAELLERATKIIAFSDSTVEIFQKAFPEKNWQGKIVIEPHAINVANYPKIKPQIRQPLKIAIIGNINFPKGANVVHEMLALIVSKQLPVSIVVIGTLDRYSASPALTITGPFENSALPTLLEQHGIGVCWLPSICPETFSYVTEEIITMEMPLVCFDLGAPASRVKHYRFGEVARETSAQGALDAIMSLACRVETTAA
jgi:glycosyltransferase involved in cell wall biosynthesis